MKRTIKLNKLEFLKAVEKTLDELMGDQKDQTEKVLELYQDDIFMDIQEVSNYAKYTVNTIYKYVNDNKIPHHKKVGRLQFKKSEIDRWLWNKNKA